MSDDVRAPAWSLFIDESGTFEVGQPSIVVAVAIRESDAAQVSTSIRRTIEDLVPEMRWPLHATELRRPLGLLTAWMRLDPALREPSANRSVAFDALVKMSARVQSAPDPEALGLLQAIRSDRRVPQSVFVAAEAWAKHVAPYDMEQLEARSAEIFDQLRFMHRLLGRRLGADNFFLLCASAPRECAQDRYLATLEALIERARWVLRSPHETREIELVVASRKVRVDGAHVYLDRTIVRDCVDRAQRATLGALADRVSVRDVRVVDYRDEVAVPMVIADFASNQLRRVCGLDQPRARIAAVARQGVGVEIVVPLASEHGEVEHGLAPPDPWRSALAEQVATGRRRATPPRPSWAQEQLREDVARVDAWRGGRS